MLCPIPTPTHTSAHSSHRTEDRYKVSHSQKTEMLDKIQVCIDADVTTKWFMGGCDEQLNFLSGPFLFPAPRSPQKWTRDPGPRFSTASQDAMARPPNINPTLWPMERALGLGCGCGCGQGPNKRSGDQHP